MNLDWVFDRLALIACAILVDLGLVWLATHPAAIAGLQIATGILALIARGRLHHPHEAEHA